MIPIDEQEWQAAERLKDSDDPKLPYTSYPNGIARAGYRKEFKQRKAKHSFLNFHGHLFAIAKREDRDLSNTALHAADNAVAGKSSHSLVKRMTGQHGETAVLKKQPAHPDPLREAYYNKKRQRELGILQDLGMSHGLITRTNKKQATKHYLHMQDLGVSLHRELHFGRQTLSNDRRLEMAIDACLSLVDLHYFARQSRTRTRYAHGDIKSTNFTVDAAGKIHLIDHGTTKTKPQSLLLKSLGTHLYAPPKTVRLEKWKYDVLMLKRVLLFPQQLRNYQNEQPHPYFPRSNSILTPELVQHYKLSHWIDTSTAYRNSDESFMQDQTTSLSLAAILIVARYRLGISYPLLAENSYLCLVIVDLYQNGVSAEEMNSLITDTLIDASTPPRITHKALQINRIRGLNVDEDSIQGSEELAKLINRLEQLGLSHHIHKIRAHKTLSQRLLTKADESTFYQDLDWLLEEIPDHAEQLGRLIDEYLKPDPVIALMIRRQVTRALHASLLDEQQRNMLLWCDTLKWSRSDFHHIVPRIILNPESMKAVSALQGANAASYPTLCQLWMSRLAAAEHPERVEIYTKTACLLKERGAAPNLFRGLFIMLEQSKVSLEMQKAILILLENNLLLTDTDSDITCDANRSRLIVHLSRLGLQSWLTAALTFPMHLVLILNTIAGSDFQGQLGSILADTSLIDRLTFDTDTKSMKFIQAAQFLIRNEYSFDDLSNQQAFGLIRLLACPLLKDEERRQKITEIMNAADSSQANCPFEGLLSYLKPPTAQAPCSSSTPQDESMAAPYPLPNHCH